VHRTKTFVRRYWQAHAAHGFDTLGELRHPDWTAEWPQSGERIHGDANARQGGFAAIVLRQSPSDSDLAK
jgi:hypothetical protein